MIVFHLFSFFILYFFGSWLLKLLKLFRALKLLELWDFWLSGCLDFFGSWAFETLSVLGFWFFGVFKALLCGNKFNLSQSKLCKWILHFATQSSV